MLQAWCNEWLQWWSQLEALWVFLFALPFLVGAAGLLADCLRCNLRGD